MLLRSMQNTQELADAKAENDALRDDVAAGRRRLHIKAVCQSVREATTPPAWMNYNWQTPCWTGLFHPQREADHYAKTTGRNPEVYLMSSADRVAHIDGHHYNYCEQYTRALPAEYKCLKHETEQSIYECLLGFCSFLFSAPPQILAASTVFLLPNSRNEEMIGDGFLWCYCCRFVLNSKRLLSTSCNKQGQRSSE